MVTNEDDILVENAKKGDREAFQTLIAKHRSKVLNWAQSVTRDPYLAEDVVQDTLIRSYLQLETLQQNDRFLPWLKNIARNRAIDYIRQTNNKQIQFADESLTEYPDKAPYTPENVVTEKEIIDTLSIITSELSDRNRLIFEAHFFSQLTYEEIAVKFQMKKSNVYNIISRVKVKLQNRWFEVEKNRYIEERKTKAMKKKNLLHAPIGKSPYTSLGHVLYELLPYIHRSELSLSDFLGLSGQAFRIQMAEDAGISSFFVYDWGMQCFQIARVLGCESRSLGKPGRVPTPQLLIEALGMIHDSIDRGIPAVAWNLQTFEFGLIYGYDDIEAQFTYYSPTGNSLHIPYDDLGRNTDHPELFVAVWKNKGGDEIDSIDALQIIISHLHGHEPIVDGYIQGITAYDSWINAVETGTVNPSAHAYHVALLTEAREHAIEFLKNLRSSLEKYENKRIMLHLHHAILHYEKAHRRWEDLYPSFPFGLPGVKMDVREKTLLLLSEIKEAEQNGVGELEKIVSIISLKSDRNSIADASTY